MNKEVNRLNSDDIEKVIKWHMRRSCEEENGIREVVKIHLKYFQSALDLTKDPELAKELTVQFLTSVMIHQRND